MFPDPEPNLSDEFAVATGAASLRTAAGTPYTVVEVRVTALVTAPCDQVFEACRCRFVSRPAG